MRDQPRAIDPEATFESVVNWVEQTARQENAPGAIIGISGTDSILVFLACAEAFKRLGKPEAVVGVHYGPELDAEQDLEPGKFTCVSSEFNWVAIDIFPWLSAQAPDAKLELNHSPGYKDDHVRWGRLFSRAVSEVGQGQGMSNNYYFPVGTRNATEDYLGTYSQISRAVSMQPIVNLYKSEVLEVCKFLGVPQVALDKSREVDCDCGRFDTAALYLEEVDAFIMKEKGELSKEFVKGWDMEVRASVMEYVLEEKERNAFREQTPYRPSQDLVIERE